MNGIQIEHILDLIEEKSEKNRQIIRAEIAIYLQGHKDKVIETLVEHGEMSIPTSYGNVKLTKADLELAVA